MESKLKAYIPSAIALLSALLIRQIGLDTESANLASALLVGVAIAIAGYQLKNKVLLAQASVILRPRISDVLLRIELAIEKEYETDIPDSLRSEILDALFGDETDGY